MSGQKPFQYERMTGSELSSDINVLRMSVGEFCRITGSAPKRVMDDWLQGVNTPPWVPVLLAGWKASPEALQAARDEAERRLLRDEGVSPME